MQKEILTVKEVAEELRTTERTIRELIKKKNLPARKVGTKYIVMMESIREIAVKERICSLVSLFFIKIFCIYPGIKKTISVS